MKLSGTSVIVSVAFIAAACASSPEGIMSAEQLASVLADLNTAEAYYAVEGVPGQLRSGYVDNDSVKKVMRQSIFHNHGVSQQQFEATLDWYGHHLDKYEDICDRSMELLEQRRSRLAAASRNATTSSDHSLWPGAISMRLAGNTGRNAVSYDIAPRGLKKGDRLQWSFSTTALIAPADVVMAVDYTDGSTALITHRLTSEGRQCVALQLDSSRVASRLYGYVQPQQRATLLMDSITLVSVPLSRTNYYEIYRQKILPAHTSGTDK